MSASNEATALRRKIADLREQIRNRDAHDAAVERAAEEYRLSVCWYVYDGPTWAVAFSEHRTPIELQHLGFVTNVQGRYATKLACEVAIIKAVTEYEAARPRSGEGR